MAPSDPAKARGPRTGVGVPRRRIRRRVKGRLAATLLVRYTTASLSNDYNNSALPTAQDCYENRNDAVGVNIKL